MNPKNLLIAAGLGFALILTSCSGKKYEANTIVKTILAKDEAAVILSIKVKDLMAKGGISTKENIPALAQMMFPEQIENLTNPEKAGLDLSGNTLMGVSVTKSETYMWVVAKIKDKEAFEKAMKDQEPEMKFKEVEGFTCIDKADKEGFLGWNEQCIVLLGGENVDAEAKFTSLAKDFGNDAKADAKYNEVMETKADFAWFTNADKFVEAQQAFSKYARVSQRELDMMKKMSDKFKGTSSLMTISFENDKIVADIKNNLSASAKKELDFFGNEGFPKNNLAALGDGEMDAFLALNGNVEGFLNWVAKVSGEDVLADAQREAGLDVKKIMSSLKGNMIFSIIGSITSKQMMFTEEGEMEERDVQQPRVAALITVKSNYLQTLADSVMGKQKMPEGYFRQSPYSSEFISFLEGQILYTNDETLAKKQVTPGSPKMDAKAEECLSKPVSFYINLNKMLNSYKDMIGVDETISSKFKIAFGTMDINGGHAELILDNGGKNSLWTIMNIGSKMGESMMSF